VLVEIKPDYMPDDTVPPLNPGDAFEWLQATPVTMIQTADDIKVRQVI